MATLNKKVSKSAPRTHEGAVAMFVGAKAQLSRLLMTCMLWEDSFYVDGKSHAELLAQAIKNVKPEDAAELAIQAREKMHLRHAPLLIARELARGTKEARLLVGDLLERIIQRPDELTEFLAIYTADKKQPLSAQVKKGLARAFRKFNAYTLAKYNGEGKYTLRDVMFLTHPDPCKNDFHGTDTYKKLADKQLESPDTWEVALSAGADKKETFTRLIEEGKLGAMALLRNLRNMIQSGVDDNIIRNAIVSANVERVLPFRFIAAARYAPQFEPQLETSMFKCLETHPKLTGTTLLLVDVSGSMDYALSDKSDMRRMDAACGLAMLLREICSDVRVVTFSTKTVEVPARRGFALRDAVVNSQGHSSTYLGQAIKDTANVQYDRIIVITDEQSHDRVAESAPKGKGYMINVANYQNGVGYGKWTHIDGWSEAIVDFIMALESNKD